MAMSFNGHEIENATFIVTDIDHWSIPTKDIELYGLAFSNKSAISTIDYPSKVIKITGYIHCDGTYELGAYIDIYKSYLSAKDANLDIDYDSGTRRYIATANKVDIKRSLSKTYASYSVEFICPEPFGMNTAATTLGSSTITAASVTYTTVAEGTAPLQYPIAKFTFNTITGAGDYFQLSNNKNGQSMVLYGLGLTNGDIVIIDSYERTVTLNGVPADYLGTFLELNLGEVAITYSDGFDTRNVTILINYYKRYL